MWGGGVPLAYLVQGAASFAAIGGVAWMWRTSATATLKAALLMIATLLASPHALDYDLTILGPAIAFMVASSWSNGFRDFDISLLAAAWITPLFARGIAGADRHPARPDRDRGAVCADDAACDARPRRPRSARRNRASVIRRVRSCRNEPQQNISGDCSAVDNFDFFHSRGLASPRIGIIV